MQEEALPEMIVDEMETVPLQPMESMQMEETGTMIDESKNKVALGLADLRSEMAGSDNTFNFGQSVTENAGGRKTFSRFADELADTISMNCRSDT